MSVQPTTPATDRTGQRLFTPFGQGTVVADYGDDRMLLRLEETGDTAIFTKSELLLSDSRLLRRLRCRPATRHLASC